MRCHRRAMGRRGDPDITAALHSLPIRLSNFLYFYQEKKMGEKYHSFPATSSSASPINVDGPKNSELYSSFLTFLLYDILATYNFNYFYMLGTLKSESSSSQDHLQSTYPVDISCVLQYFFCLKSAFPIFPYFSSIQQVMWARNLTDIPDFSFTLHIWPTAVVTVTAMITNISNDI